ncbi:MAG: glycosyltransferase family 4 protein [Gemmatimonadaceae bacterium]
MSVAALRAPGISAVRTVCLVIASLQAGGAERVMVSLAAGLTARGWRVVLITLASADTDFYPVPTGVVRHSLDMMMPSGSVVQAAMRNVSRLRVLRRAIASESPVMSISFVDKTNVLTLLAMAGTGFPVIVSERIDPRHYHPGLAWQTLRRLVYPTAAALVVQTQAVVPWAHTVARRAEVAVIPNPVPDAEQAPHPRTRRQRIVGVGRLVPQKGFDVLIAAFATIAARHADWDLMIIGGGPLHDELLNRAVAAGVADRVTFTGVRPDVHALVAESEIFVLSSRFEGFPNTLVEAMALGCAVVACACPSGPEEIISHGEDGLLVGVDDAADLARALDRLITSPEERARLRRNALAVRQRFSPTRVLDSWEALIDNHAQPVADAAGRHTGRSRSWWKA